MNSREVNRVDRDGRGPRSGNSAASAGSSTDAQPRVEPLTPIQVEQRVRSAFTAPIDAGKPSGFYMFSLAIAAMTVLVLPLIYLALVASVCWVTWLHATGNMGLLGQQGGSGIGRGRGAMWSMVIYLMGIVGGVVVVLFMLKPFFAPRQRAMRPYGIDPHEAPGLYALVGQMCGAMGAPVPRKIEIDIRANASAGFRRGFLSFLGDDLVLIVGLPLAGALTVRELAGVVAHEFGHFRQGAGMRLYYLVESINGWFARVVYQRDAWDATLENAAANSPFVIGIMLHLTRLCVFLSRGVLWLLMHIGAAVSGFASRQMEFDADRCEVAVAGSRAFKRTFEKVVQLSVGDERAGLMQYTAWRAGVSLADDIPRLVIKLAANIGSDDRNEMKKQFEWGKTGLFDSHPSPRDRVKAAHALDSPGLSLPDVPARTLFANYPALCKAATQVFFTQVLGRTLPPNHLVSVEDFLAGGRAAATRRAAEADSQQDIPLQ